MRRSLARFGDTPFDGPVDKGILTEEDAERMTPQQGLRAKLAGGANMFRSSGPLQIGDANAKTVAQAVQKIGAQIEAHEVGGTKGRRVTFDCDSGEFTVESAGQPKRVL